MSDLTTANPRIRAADSDRNHTALYAVQDDYVHLRGCSVLMYETLCGWCDTSTEWEEDVQDPVDCPGCLALLDHVAALPEVPRVDR